MEPYVHPKKWYTAAVMTIVMLSSPALAQEYSDNIFTSRLQRAGDRLKYDMGFGDWDRTVFWTAFIVFAFIVLMAGAWVYGKIKYQEDVAAEQRRIKIRDEAEKRLGRRF